MSRVQWQNLTLHGNVGFKLKLFLDVTIQTKTTALQAEKGLKFAGRASGLERERKVSEAVVWVLKAVTRTIN